MGRGSKLPTEGRQEGAGAHRQRTEGRQDGGRDSTLTTDCRPELAEAAS